MGVPPASDALDADATPRQGSTQHQQHQIRPFRLKKQPESSSFDGFDGGPPASDALDLDADATPRQGSKPSIPSIPSIGSSGSKIVFSTSLTPSTQTEPTQKQLRARFLCSGSTFWDPNEPINSVNRFFGIENRLLDLVDAYVSLSSWPGLMGPGAGCGPGAPDCWSVSERRQGRSMTRRGRGGSGLGVSTPLPRRMGRSPPS